MGRLDGIASRRVPNADLIPSDAADHLMREESNERNGETKESRTEGIRGKEMERGMKEYSEKRKKEDGEKKEKV